MSVALTRDLSGLDWNAVPDVGQKLPCGFVQLKITGWEEKMSSSEGVKKDGSPKVAKYMLLAHLEAMAPVEAEGITRDEYFVLGGDEDPLMQKLETFYSSIGAKNLKKMLADAQVPWSSSLVQTVGASVGAMFVCKVTHKAEKRRDTGEDVVGVQLGATFKVGEKAPSYIPCNLPGCDMCVTAKQAMGGVVGGGLPGGMPVAPQGYGPGGTAGSLTAAQLPPKPVAPPAMPMGGGAVMPAAPVAPVMPTMPATPSMPKTPTVPLMPAAPPVAPLVPSSAPPSAPPLPASPAASPAPPAIGGGVVGGSGGMRVCPMCKGQVEEAGYMAHVQACAQAMTAQAMAGFKQEV